MILHLYLDTHNFHKAADTLLVEMAFQMQPASDSLSSLALLMGINRGVLSRKLRSSGKYDEFMSKYKLFATTRYSDATIKKAKAEAEKQARIESYTQYITNKNEAMLIPTSITVKSKEAFVVLPFGVPNVSK